MGAGRPSYPFIQVRVKSGKLLRKPHKLQRVVGIKGRVSQKHGILILPCRGVLEKYHMNPDPDDEQMMGIGDKPK